MTLERARDQIFALLERFETHPASVLSIHADRECCLMARQWVLSLDRSTYFQANKGIGPKWLRERWKWGPVHWPVYWCGLPKIRYLDCGVFAALSCDIFASRGFSVVPVQLIQRYSEQDVGHWSALWSEANLPSGWIEGEYVYHEACGVVQQEKIRIWDPVDSVWLFSGEKGMMGYGSVVAIRLRTQELSSTPRQEVKWFEHRLDMNEWHLLIST